MMSGHGHGEIGRVWRDGERERDGRFRERGRGRFRETERWRVEEREMGRRVRKLDKKCQGEGIMCDNEQCKRGKRERETETMDAMTKERNSDR